MSIQNKIILAVDGCFKSCSVSLSLPKSQYNPRKQLGQIQTNDSELFEETETENDSIILTKSSNLPSMQTLYIPKFTREILEICQLKSSNIQDIIANAGPGTFTGIRSSLSFLEGLSTFENQQTFSITSTAITAYYAYSHLQKKSQESQNPQELKGGQGQEWEKEEKRGREPSPKTSITFTIIIQAIRETFYFQRFDASLEKMEEMQYLNSQEVVENLNLFVKSNPDSDSHHYLAGYQFESILRSDKSLNQALENKDFTIISDTYLPNSQTLIHAKYNLLQLFTKNLEPFYLRQPMNS